MIMLYIMSYISMYEVSVEMYRLHFLIIYLLSPSVKDEEKNEVFWLAVQLASHTLCKR